MPNLTSVTLTSGVPTAGTGTVSTLDNLVGSAGTASAQVLTVQGIASGTAQATTESQVLADNAAFSDGSTKVFVAGFVYDEVAGTALTENDAAAARVDAKRAQIGTIEDGSTRGRYATVTASNELKVTGAVTVASGGIAAGAVAAGATSFVKLEDAAAADADAGVPAMAIRKAAPANTSGTDGDYEMLQMSAGRLWTNTLLGDGTNSVAVKAASTSAASTDPSLVVQLSPQNMPFLDTSNFTSGVSANMTGTTSTSCVAAAGVGLRNYITSITVTNSHATVGTDVLIQDGSGGTTLWRIPAAAVYGGATITFPTPLRQPTTNTAIYVQNVTTGASTYVSICGYKAA